MLFHFPDRFILLDFIPLWHRNAKIQKAVRLTGSKGSKKGLGRPKSKKIQGM